MLRRSRRIQYKGWFQPELQQPPAPAASAWQGVEARPLQFSRPTGWFNYQHPVVFWTPLPISTATVFYSAVEGSNVRSLAFQKGAPGWQNYQKESLFWDPFPFVPTVVFSSSFEGSNVRPAQLQRGPANWDNFKHPLYHWTPFPIIPPVVFESAWQGSNERPWIYGRSTGWLNYQHQSFFWTFKSAAVNSVNLQSGRFPFTGLSITPTFGVLCNPLPDLPLVDVWTSDPPYCKPGQT
jgi:hypothetical protein